MIKIVDKYPFDSRCDNGGFDKGFILVGNSVEVRSLKSYEREIGFWVVDDIGHAFLVHQNPAATCEELMCFTDFVKGGFFTDETGEVYGAHLYDEKRNDVTKFNGANRLPVCVDSRVIMAHLLLSWVLSYSVGEEGDVEFDAAINPLPTIEEAHKWLLLNRFCGDNRYRYCLYPCHKLDNVPPAIQALHDKRYGKAEKYPWEIDAEEEALEEEEE